MRKPLIAGNWKMNGSRRDSEALLQALKTGLPSTQQAEWVVLPPFVYLHLTQSLLEYSGVKWGAQNASAYSSGAYTGEVAVHMLQDFGCSYVVIGHSERRQLFQEEEASVAQKLEQAARGGITPIVCLGESYDHYQQGLSEAFVHEQIMGIVSNLTDLSVIKNAVFAYEPIWAIGTGLSASAQQVQTVHSVIRAALATAADEQTAQTLRILYGGSVKPENAAELLAQTDVDGCLVGGASLSAEKFIGICRACLESTAAAAQSPAE